MDTIEQFINLLFQEIPPDEDTEAAKAALLERLEEEYLGFLEEGLTPKAAATQVLFFFGAREGAREEVAHQRLARRYARFQRKYPILVRCGFLGILLVPALVMVLFLNLEGKLTALAGWIVSILALVTYIICLEYFDYRYRRLLKLDPEPKQAAHQAALREISKIPADPPEPAQTKQVKAKDRSGKSAEGQATEPNDRKPPQPPDGQGSGRQNPR